MVIWRGFFIGIIIAAALFTSVLFYRGYDYHKEILRLGSDMISLEERMTFKSSNWVDYLEGRVNRVAKSQDEYQWSTSKRVEQLSSRITELEEKVRELKASIKEEAQR